MVSIVVDLLDVGVLVVLDGVWEFELGDCEGSDIDEDWVRVDVVFDVWFDGDVDVVLLGVESGRVVLYCMCGEFEGFVDLYCGEMVVVVSYGGVMSFVLFWLVYNVCDDWVWVLGIANCGVVEFEGDSDGWWLLLWLV